MMTYVTDRKKQPELQTLEEIDLARPEVKYLDNGIPVHVVNGGTQELTKLQFIFPAGKWHEPKKLVAHAVAKLIKEGTAHLSGAQIAERTEYYGASLKTHVDTDHAFVNIYCLNKYVQHILPIAKEILTISMFPERELEIFVKNRKQKLKINEQKNDYIVRRKYNEALFGSEHPYGYSPEEKYYDALAHDDLMDFYKEHYTGDNCKIILSGQVLNEPWKELNSHFGTDDWLKQKKTETMAHTPQPSTEKKLLALRSNAVQSALQVGRHLFNKTHKDYPGMLVLNTILGGYFGSRLMSNIREDKGFTYGIYSVVVSMINGGYFYITSDVGADVCSKAIDEIFFELKRLQEEPVSKEELEVVRNYLLGRLLASVDGPFKASEVIRGLILYGLEVDYFYKIIDTVSHITPEELQQLAQKYFNPEDMYEVVVGRK